MRERADRRQRDRGAVPPQTGAADLALRVLPADARDAYRADLPLERGTGSGRLWPTTAGITANVDTVLTNTADAGCSRLPPA